ncbi:phosphorylase [Sphingomonas sp. BAUL-RG-20F-R05-02]|uniref:phosphorylase family protein n=1 Tax=Sphingomonas sp. BAUL-RG-20F-R05-02 TaxID=2914830 RepID=UPI001F5A750E|nr:phosphorylase [Sphingomonas sp. BAUL-RG-20F-R05-02]
MTLLVACGLTREAGIIRRVGVIPLAGGGDPARLEALLEDAIATFGPFSGVVSSGVAGGLDPALRPGDVVIGTLAASGSSSGRESTLVEALRARLPGAHVGTIAGSDTIAATLDQKHALRSSTGAIAVDMESHIAARVAARHALPFAIIRAISDGADHVLPPAALVGMKPDGGMALGKVLASLARRPTQMRALVRTGRDAGRAFSALSRSWAALGDVGGEERDRA